MSRRRSLRALAVLYPCTTAFAVIATGNHFVLDIVAGLAAIALAVLCVHLASGWWRTAGTACHKVVTKSKTR